LAFCYKTAKKMTTKKYHHLCLQPSKERHGPITSVIGWNGDEYLSLILVDVDTVGNYNVGIATQSTGSYSDDSQESFYVSRQGWVNISEYTDTRVKGTFEFIAIKPGTAADTVLVDNGLFDISRSE